MLHQTYVKASTVLQNLRQLPIDDRRTTGISDARFWIYQRWWRRTYSSAYLNLAPNYDATLTPRYIGNRGAMLGRRIPLLNTGKYGTGRVSGGYLAADNEYNDQDRKGLQFLHNWQINNQFSTNIEYNYVDKDYFSDLK